MKILQINSVNGVGSTGRIAVELAKQQLKSGMTPVIAYGRGTESSDLSIPTIKIGASQFNIYEHLVEERFFDNGGFASRRATKQLIKRIEKFKPDIVHLHNLHGYYLNTALLFEYLRQSDCKVILTLHDCWPFSPQSAYIDRDQDGKVPNKVQSKSEFNEYPKTYCRFRSQSLYNKKVAAFTVLSKERFKIVTPSNWLTDLAKESFLCKYQIETIHNGIDLNQFKPTTENYFETHYQLKNKKIILGAANIWEPRKGLVYFDYLAQNLPSNYQVVVVGRDTDQLQSDNILKIQQTNDISELANIYASADLFVNPTMAENFPTSNIEALASGTPVITFNTGGSPESLNIEVGRVVPKGDSEALLQACLGFEKTAEVVTACVKQAHKFDKEIAYDRYIALYQSWNGE